MRLRDFRIALLPLSLVLYAMMNQHFEKGLTKEVHPLVRVIVSVVLCVLGCLCSILWIITNNPVAGLIGLLCGIPCIVMGVALLLNRARQTRLSPNGLRLFGLILFIGGVIGIYKHQPYASLLIVFAISCFKIAKQTTRVNGI